MAVNCVGGGREPPLFLLSQLSSDFTGTCILFVILRVVDVVRIAEQERNCILSWLLLRGVPAIDTLRMGAHKSWRGSSVGLRFFED